MEITTFRPTAEEFNAGLASYVLNVVEKDSHTRHCGLAKVIPPDTWWISGTEAEQLCLKEAAATNTLVRPIKQHLSGVRGTYRVDLVDTKPLSVAGCRARSKTIEEQLGTPLTDRDFWRSLGTTSAPSQYGADQVGTLFKDREVGSGWNLNKLDSILSYGLPQKLGGITTPMLYYGEPKAIFAWHCEDMDLNSVNYLHFGASKVWYAIAPENATRLESLAQSFFGECANECKEFMRHKNILISPNQLEKSNIPYCRAEQHAREFMITLPRSYHCGWNKGWNCAESVNFATRSWIPYGRRASWCSCEEYVFKADMDVFVDLVRKRCPEQLASSPSVGDLIVVAWKGWGSALVRVVVKGKGKDRGNGGKSSSSSSSSSSSKPRLLSVRAVGKNGSRKAVKWNFDPLLDEWRWPRQNDYTPSVGQILFVNEKKVRVVENVGQQQDGLFRNVVVEPTSARNRKRYSFHPKTSQWHWPTNQVISESEEGEEGSEVEVFVPSVSVPGIRNFFPVRKRRNDGWVCIKLTDFKKQKT